ncbi:hypothetical protein [Methylobacterium sp. J-067]|uniref:hypothetical protein n=1 Tax=Methylobacterium sp. J-067 TaxID=2836648 RepID=UPI001FBB9294|nr:hypothetical protein [Methylobacterium sp. J-067]MCJ2025098.1 hypothetical protein [Methylobacterium sp. J-067]
MRMIYALLALYHVRQARFEVARADMMLDGAEAAQARSRARIVLADAFAARADLPPFLSLPQ